MKRSISIIVLILVIDGVLAFLLVRNHPEQIPTIFISSIALGFSYYAYRFSKERFRLDLFDKRWEIYQQVLKFCSVVMTHGGLPKAGADEDLNKSVVSGLEAAHESFRGIGLHKAKALFGPEIQDKFKTLNEMYAWFVSQPRYEGWAQKEHDYLGEIWDTINELPDLFKPYVYFGDYKDS